MASAWQLRSLVKLLLLLAGLALQDRVLLSRHSLLLALNLLSRLPMLRATEAREFNSSPALG